MITRSFLHRALLLPRLRVLRLLAVITRLLVRRAPLTFPLILPLVARSLPRAMSGLLLLGFPLLNSDPLGALGTFAALCHRPVEVDSKVLEATAATGSGTKVAEKNELRSCQPMRAPSAAHPSQEAALLRSMIDSLLCGRHGRRQLKCMWTFAKQAISTPKSPTKMQNRVHCSLRHAGCEASTFTNTHVPFIATARATPGT